MPRHSRSKAQMRTAANLHELVPLPAAFDAAAASLSCGMGGHHACRSPSSGGMRGCLASRPGPRSGT